MAQPETTAQQATMPGKGFVQLMREEPRYQIGAIMVLATIPRLAYLVQMMRWPFFYSPVLDSRSQYQWATLLLRTFGIGDAAAMSKGPLYPYFLALNQLAMGEGHPSMFSARLVQLALGAVTCGLIYLLGQRVFGKGVGLLAGLMAAAYSPMIFEDGELLDTALATFLATVFLLSVLASLESPARGRWFGGGVLLGLLGLTRPNLLSLGLWALVLVLIWDSPTLQSYGDRARRQRPIRERMGRAWPLVVGALLAIAPITARNYVITGNLVPIANNAGINFYTGNNASADGYSPIPAGVRWERAQYAVTNSAPDVYQHGIVDVSKATAYWNRRAMAFWRSHTWEALALLAKKAYLYWNAYEIPNNLSYDWGRSHASALRWAPMTFAVLGPLALLGMVMMGWRGRRQRALVAFVLVQMVAVIAFFVCGRYRMPALPVLFVFAGCALAGVAGAAQRRRWGRVAAALAGLAICGVLVNSDWYGVTRARGANRDWFYVGQSYYGAQQYRQAKEAWEQAIEQHPEDADAYSFLGNAEAQLGEYRSAVGHMRKALELAPDFANAAAQMAQVYLEEGWPLEEPARLLARAVREEYLNQFALGTLIAVYVRMGRPEEAREALELAARAVALATPLGRSAPLLGPSLARGVQDAQAAGVQIPDALLPARGPSGAGGL